MKEHIFEYQGLQRPFWSIEAVPSDRVALRIGVSGEVVSYGTLLAKRDELINQFGAGRGILRIAATPSVNFITAYLAALEAGYPMLLEEPGSDAGDAIPCLYRLDNLSGEIVTDASGSGGIKLHPELRLLLSTSGSTGARKFVRLSSDNLSSNAATIARYLKLNPDDRAPTSLPLSYSYGLSVLNSTLAAGASLVLIDEPIVSRDFWEQFEANGCTSFSGVPQSFKLLSRGEQLFRDRPSLRYVTQAGGKMPSESVKMWGKAGRDHDWDFFVMYGQTEAAPRIAYLPPALTETNPSSIGVAIPGGELEVCDAEGQPLPPGQEGELVYRGPNVMMGYATNADDLAKGSTLRELKTGDLGRVDENGLFYITGRASRFLKISGKRISLDSVEAWLANNGVDGIATGQDDALAVIHTGASGLAARLAKWLAIPSTFVDEIEVDTLPLNQNGKHDLRAAAELFSAHNTKQEVAAGHGGDVSKGSTEIIELFRHQFPGRDITPDASFDQLGGSSNDFVELELALEREGVDPFENWQIYSISALSELVVDREKSRSWLAPDHAAARALCCIFVVMLHVIGLQEGSGGLNLPDSSGWHDLSDFLDPLRMPLFALLSGYAFYVMGSDRRTFGAHMGNIAKRLLAPTLFAMACFALASDLVGNDFMIETPQDALNLLYLPYAHFWFVMAVVLMMTATYLATRYLARYSSYLIAAAIAALALNELYVSPNVWAINEAALLMPFFLCGYVYGLSAQTLHAKIDLLAVIAVGIALLCWTLPEGSPVVARGVAFMLSLSYIALCVALAGKIPLLSAIAPYTFFIYLWHVFGTSASRRGLKLLGVDSVPLHLVFGTVAGVLLPIALFHLLERAPGRIFVRGK